MNELEFCKRVLEASPRTKSDSPLTFFDVKVCLVMAEHIKGRFTAITFKGLWVKLGRPNRPSLTRALQTLERHHFVTRTRTTYALGRLHVALTPLGLQFVSRIVANKAAQI